MGVEVTGGEKAIRTFLLWGCAIVIVAYLWATWGNMAVIEAGGRTGPPVVPEAIGVALGRWTGAAVSLVLAWVILTVGVVYNYSFGRLLFVSGLEEAPAAPDRQGQQEQGAGERDHAADGDLDDPRDPDLLRLRLRRERPAQAPSTSSTPA